MGGNKVSNQINDGGSAFPNYPNVTVPIAENCADKTKWINEHKGGTGGLTKREWFAGMAIEQAWKAEHAAPSGDGKEPTYAGVARRAFLLADALLAESEKGKVKS